PTTHELAERAPAGSGLPSGAQIGTQIVVLPDGTLVDIFEDVNGSGRAQSPDPGPRIGHPLHRPGLGLVAVANRRVRVLLMAEQAAPLSTAESQVGSGVLLGVPGRSSTRRDVLHDRRLVLEVATRASSPATVPGMAEPVAHLRYSGAAHVRSF